MTAAVETMAYTNQVPWHGLGTHVADAPSVDKMLTLAQLDWNVEKRAMAYVSDGAHYDGKVDRHFALVRDSDGSCLDVVGKTYTPVQNREAFEFFTEFVEAGNATMETAGSLRGGRYVWGLANLGVGFKLRNDDQVNGYLLVAAPHEAGKSFLIKFTAVRVVCQNTLSLALSQGGTEFRMAHRRQFDNKMVEVAKDTLGIARDQVGELEKNARILQKMKMTRDDTIRVLAPIYQPQTDMKELLADFDANAAPRMKALIDINNRAPGAEPDTAWGTLNAVTYYADHVASRGADKRLTNAWFGKTANQKVRVLDALLQRAA